MTFKPLEHQLSAQKSLITMENKGKGGFLCDGMGMGKTITMSMHLTKNRTFGKTDLIVCPLSMLTTWQHWLEKVNTWVNGNTMINILLYHGTKRKNMLKDCSKIDIVITTYSIIGTGELNKRRWGRVILDESHTIKNGLKNKAPKCAKAAYTISKLSDFRFCISGTPFNNRVSDIAAQALFIGTKPYNNPKWWDTCNEEDKRVWREQFVIRRTKDGMLKKPLYHDIYVNHTDDEEKLVSKVRVAAHEDFKAWKVARRNGDNYTRMKLQGELLSLIQRLRVISNSYYTGGGEIKNVEKVIENNAKVKKMVSDLRIFVNSDSKKGVVLFSQFTSFLKVFEQVINFFIPDIEVLKFYGDMDIQERDKTVHIFNNSRNPRVILVSLLAGGVGLSLHTGSSTVMISEPYYNPFMEQQAEERVHRLGQESQVKVYRYYVNNSVEKWVNSLKQKKLILAGGFSLVVQDKIPVGFNFDDIADLFKEHVAFTKKKEEEKNETKEKGKRKKSKRFL